MTMTDDELAERRAAGARQLDIREQLVRLLRAWQPPFAAARDALEAVGFGETGGA